MTNRLLTLEDAWAADMAAHRASGPTADEIYADVLARHAEPARHYHGRAHLRALVELLRIYAPHIPAGAPPRLAIWWHDAVYDAQARDNEERSADLAREHLTRLGADAATIDETVHLIHITKNHWNGPPTGDGDYFLDADIAILGAPSAKYDEYATQVREEYAWVPVEAYRTGRSAFLNHAIANPRLFRTDIFESTYAAQARENMKRELASLSGAP
jgi:predicted metal-dependent HD superfamily phosphohydrolase